MGVNVAALLILAVLITMLSMLARSTIISNTVVGLTMERAVDRAGERGRTNFTIQSTTGGGANLTVVVINSGSSPVSDLPHMDFIVDYTGTAGGGAQVIARLTYTQGALSNNQWKKSSITPDEFEPGTWNPGETMTLDAQLDPPQQSATTGTVAVGTPNGVSATAYFSN